MGLSHVQTQSLNLGLSKSSCSMDYEFRNGKKKKFTRKSLRIAIMKLKTLLSSPTIKRLCISCTICSFSKCIIFEAARYKIRISGELAFYEEALANNDTARGMMTVFNVHICFAQVLINVSNNLTILLASKHLRLRPPTVG